MEADLVHRPEVFKDRRFRVMSHFRCGSRFTRTPQHEDSSWNEPMASSMQATGLYKIKPLPWAG